MPTNLLDTVKNYFTPDFISEATSGLGESSVGISKALSGLIPAGLAGIMSKASSGTEGANSIFNMAKEAAGGLSSSPNFNSLLNPATTSGGANMLSGLFGANQSSIAGMVSRFAGIKDSSASALMSMVLPVILGLLGKHATQNNMSPSGLSGFLASQKDSIMNALPSGLSSITGMLGLGSMSAPHVNLDAKPGGTKWLIPLIIILAVIALLWYFFKGCNKTPETAMPVPDTSTVYKETPPATPAAKMGESLKVKLPNGKELDAYKGGIEDQLVAFLNGNWKSMSDEALKAKWFNFDNLNFETDKATLMAESEKQLDNIAEILKAFPDAKIKIGGYTDVSGNAAANKKLSQDRADAARSGLAKRGVGAQVTGAEGYGAEFAKYPATASEEERAGDRHVSVSVRK